MTIRRRIENLERRGQDPCPACGTGGNATPTRVSYWHPGEPKPEAPPPCGRCGQPPLWIVVQYVDRVEVAA